MIFEGGKNQSSTFTYDDNNEIIIKKEVFMNNSTKANAIVIHSRDFKWFYKGIYFYFKHC